MLKNSDIIFLVYTVTFYVRTQVFVEITFYVAWTEKTKKMSCSRVGASKFIFFAGDINFFFENLCTNIKCLDIYTNIYFRIFWHVKMYFHTTGSYAPVSRSGFPAKKASTEKEGFFFSFAGNWRNWKELMNLEHER
jgi:hypothetical protein